MLVFHPSWGYFCHEYNLTLIALEEEGQDPSSEHYVEILEEIELHNVGVIFVQEQISTSVAEAFAKEACVEIVQINPLPANYIDSLNATANTLAIKLDQLPSCQAGLPGFSIPLVILSISSILLIILIKKRRR
jgi:zinc transport system substrate-binding protein